MVIAGMIRYPLSSICQVSTAGAVAYFMRGIGVEISLVDNPINIEP